MPGKSKALQQAEAQAAQDGRGAEGAYNPGFPTRARDLCLLGHTNQDLATAFGVDISTIDRWMVEKPAFKREVLKGREAADGKVAAALYRRATGWTVKKERAVVVQGEVKTLFLKEELPGDTNAAALWLSNRQRSKWRAANAGSDDKGGFDLAAFVGALGKAIADSRPAPGDQAQPVEPLDVVLEPDKKG